MLNYRQSLFVTKVSRLKEVVFPISHPFFITRVKAGYAGQGYLSSYEDRDTVPVEAQL